jgi:hypothetical protein
MTYDRFPPRGDRFPGDNAPESSRPEVVAAEQRMLTYADALLTWMRKEDFGITDIGPSPLAYAMDRFFTHVHGAKNPGWGPSAETPMADDQVWMLDKMDYDANRLLLELLRAAWERRCWRARYGEINEARRP